MASNMMNLMKAKYAAMSNEKRVMTAKQAGNTIEEGIIEHEANLTLAYGAPLLCLKLGFCSQELSVKQKVFLQELFQNIEGAKEAATAVAVEPICETDYKVIQLGEMIGREVYEAMFDMVMCAAYADKGLDAEVEAKIDPLFGKLFLILFVESGLESVPAPKQKVTGLEARILDRMFKMRDDGETLPTFKTIRTAFPEESETSVQNALNSLCEKDLVHYMYGLLFKPYSVDIDREDVIIDLADESSASKDVSAKKTTKKNADDISTAEKKESEKKETAKKTAELPFASGEDSDGEKDAQVFIDESPDERKAREEIEKKNERERFAWAISARKNKILQKRIEQQEKANREAAEREAKRKAERVRKDREIAERKAYYDALESWRTAVRKTEAKRKSELNRLREERRKTLLEEYDRVYTAEQTTAVRVKTDAEAKREQAQKKLASLGAFKISEKKEQKALIAEAESEIAQANADLAAIADKKAEALASIEESLAVYISEQTDRINAMIPMPAKPEKPACVKA